VTDRPIREKGGREPWERRPTPPPALQGRHGRLDEGRCVALSGLHRIGPLTQGSFPPPGGQSPWAIPCRTFGAQHRSRNTMSGKQARGSLRLSVAPCQESCTRGEPCADTKASMSRMSAFSSPDTRYAARIIPPTVSAGASPAPSSALFRAPNPTSSALLPRGERGGARRRRRTPPPWGRRRRRA